VPILEALRSWRYGKAQLTAAVRRAQCRSAVKLVLTTGACMAAMVLIVVPLLTLEADARGGGGGGHGGGGHGGGGPGGGGRGGVALGWFGPLFWPYAYYDLFDYVYWPYAYDDFWPYAYDDVYYGIYGPYAYGGPYAYRRYSDPNGYYAGRSTRRGVSAGRNAAANGAERRAAEACSADAAQLTDWPIERISEIVQPTAAQWAALDELKDTSVKAAQRLETECPAYQTLTPTGRVEAMEKRLDTALGTVKTVGPALVKFYNSLSDEQKARFNSLRSASRPTD